MDKILLDECIHISDECKKYLLQFSNNSIRELINHLEKIFILQKQNDTVLSLEQCKKICSNICSHQFEEYIKLLRTKKMTDAIKLFYNIYELQLTAIASPETQYILGYIKSYAEIRYPKLP